MSNKGIPHPFDYDYDDDDDVVDDDDDDMFFLGDLFGLEKTP